MTKDNNEYGMDTFDLDGELQGNMENEIAELKELDELDDVLGASIEADLDELKFLEEDFEKIGSPDTLGNTVMKVVWEQFENQIAATAGAEFVKSNHGMNLDLSNSAHIQTSENFAKGEFASHNLETTGMMQIQYAEMQSNFKHDDKGNVIKKYDNRSGQYKEVLKKDAREPYDRGRPVGKNGNDMDHVISAGEIMRDPDANAFLTEEARVKFANSEVNLMEMDASANRSKGDSTMKEFVESQHDGKTPDERFDFDKEKALEKDEISREEYEEQIEAGRKAEKIAGRKSQTKEALKMGGKALQAFAMSLLLGLGKKIFQKFILWLKEGDRKLNKLLEYIKGAIKDFISQLKTHLINGGKSVGTAIASALFGPIVTTVQKAWTALKQVGSTVKDCIKTMKDPANKNKPFDELIAIVGKVVIIGLTAAGAISLGQTIEVGLKTIPVFAIEIPILGSLASLLGIFMGGLIAGLIGAIAINLINKHMANKKKKANLIAQSDKTNDILYKQDTQINIKKVALNKSKAINSNNIKDRHQKAANRAKEIMDHIMQPIEWEDTDVEILIEESEDKEYKKEIKMDANKKINEVNKRANSLMNLLDN